MAINWNLQGGNVPKGDVLSRFNEGYDTGRDRRVEGLQDKVGRQMNAGGDIGSMADWNTLAAIAPEKAMQQKEAMTQISGARRQKYVSTMMKAKAALEMGNGEDAMGYLDTQIADVTKQGGDPANSMYVRNLIKKDPQQALAGLAKMESTLAQQGVVELTPEDEKRKNRRVQSSENLDGGTMITYSDGSQEFKKYGNDMVNNIKEYKRKFKPKLTAGQIAAVLDTQKEAHTSRRLASSAKMMADKISKSDPKSGIVAKGSELWKKVWGSENEISSMRKHYTRIVNEFVVKTLPPGVASDRDIALIREGYLEPTANPAQISNFLNSLSRVQEDAAGYNDFRAAFLERSGGIEVADRPFEYRGVSVNEGESLDDAYSGWISTKYGDRKEEQQKTEKNNNIINWGDL